MTNQQWQFHADPRELLGWAQRWVTDHGLHAVVQGITPDHRVRPAADGDVAAAAAALGARVDRVCLHPAPPVLGAPAPHLYLAANPEVLVLDLAHPTPGGLRQSVLGLESEDEETLKLWRKLLRQAKAGTHAGASMIGPQGDTAPARSSRHTPGAHDLAASGVPMLALAGTVRFVFDDVA
ncbi:hypothetical protein L6E12_05480 [Actinokineospora sp. PR83]|uniref:hypothetical protein n=1 Tax=Actinokineospora sp. PR83 TaxID=2884908 RepID=UPI001F30CEC7|nr:hypothetical protein [Actinokineospora sp. PR83]MCG8915241.1 hypothetical protein [Actinokineospora sp. PR83]